MFYSYVQALNMQGQQVLYHISSIIFHFVTRNTFFHQGGYFEIFFKYFGNAQLAIAACLFT